MPSYLPELLDELRDHRADDPVVLVRRLRTHRDLDHMDAYEDRFPGVSELTPQGRPGGPRNTLTTGSRHRLSQSEMLAVYTQVRTRPRWWWSIPTWLGRWVRGL